MGRFPDLERTKQTEIGQRRREKRYLIG